jgi:adenylate cyclase, class 2
MKTATSHARKNLEIEVKLKIARRRGLRARLKALGFRELCHRKFEENWILDFPRRNLFKKHCLLRLRYFEGRALLTFKGPRTASHHFKIREELETEVADGTKFHRILKRLGFIRVFRYQKYRSIFEKIGRGRLKRILICIDETPIGDYLELEGPRESIRVISEQLGYALQDFVTQSYPELYVKNKQRLQSREMVFKK